jgi:L-ascorbate metabolism protein UlaG (beta-lactamase superfamily)
MLLFMLSSLAGEDVRIIPITHASLILTWEGKTIHVDPWSRGEYEGQPKADLILITDSHGDHMDLKQIAEVSKEDTVIIAPLVVQETVTQAEVLKNGESTTMMGIGIEAVPMYNLKRGPDPGRLYHPKGRGNGYIVTLGETRVYISGDTACTPEMKQLKDIDIAFVCMNLPYTMPPEEAAECVNAFKPAVVYPYHSRGSDLEVFKKAVTAPGVDVRVLDWY